MPAVRSASHSGHLVRDLDVIFIMFEVVPISNNFFNSLHLFEKEIENLCKDG